MSGRIAYMAAEGVVAPGFIFRPRMVELLEGSRSYGRRAVLLLTFSRLRGGGASGFVVDLFGAWGGAVS